MPIVYSLKNPLTDKIYYVGFTTKTISERLIAHLYSLKHDNTRQLVSKNMKPIIEVIEEGESVTMITELYWMQRLAFEGHCLENQSGLVKYQNRSNLYIKEAEILMLESMPEVDRFRFALEKIKEELPLSSNIPIIIRIKNIIETVFSFSPVIEDGVPNGKTKSRKLPTENI